MSNPIWPVDLPQAPLVMTPFSRNSQLNVIRSTVDSGLAKVRKKYTKKIVLYSCAISVTTAQLASFDSFVESSVNGGASEFDWKSFPDGAACTYRFVDIADPQAQSADRFLIHFTLERMP